MPKLTKQFSGSGPPTHALMDHISIVVTSQTGDCLQSCRYCNRTNRSRHNRTTEWVTHLIGSCPGAPLDVKRSLARKSHSAPVRELARQKNLLSPRDDDNDGKNSNSSNNSSNNDNDNNNNNNTTSNDGAADGARIPPVLAAAAVPPAPPAPPVAMMPPHHVMMQQPFQMPPPFYQHPHHHYHPLVPPPPPNAPRAASSTNPRATKKRRDSGGDDNVTGNDGGEYAAFSAASMMGVPPPPPFSYQFPPPPPLPPGGSSPAVVGSRPSITTAATFPSSLPLKPSPAPAHVAASAAGKRSSSSTGTTAGALSASSDEITIAIIKFIAGCGLPVMIVESNFFIDLIVALNRQYAHQYLTQLHANDLVRMWLPQLYASVHAQLVQQTRATDQNDVLHTMGGDGFFHDMVVSTTTARGEGNHRRPVHHLTDSVFHVSSYFDCVESQHHDMQRCYDADNGEDAAATATATAAPAVKEDDLANVLIQRLEAKAKAEGKESVEDYFAAVVWDLTDPVNSLEWSSSSSSYPDDKLAATSNSLDLIVAKTYPRVFGNTCRIRSTNLLADDLGNIPEIRATMDSALQIATFVLSRPLVIQAYHAIQAKSESQGSLIKIIPPRRAGFCHADEMLQSLLGTNDENIDSLLALARRVEQWIADDEENCDLDRD